MGYELDGARIKLSLVSRMKEMGAETILACEFMAYIKEKLILKLGVDENL